MHTYMIESLMISFLTSFNVFQRVSTYIQGGGQGHITMAPVGVA